MCDYLLCLSPHQLLIKSPVLVVAEGRREDVSTAVGPCIAKMAAVQHYHRAEGRSLPTVYGVATIGNQWRFLRLIGTTVYVDKTEYYLKEADKIVGILMAMLHDAAAQQAQG